ncbi:T9SS C-terminal target domain-containing protein [Flavobacterium sp. RNTU_13]|uniref:T9SS C-terminal target domain-containing protein n=1 Tax=Flavobacterium sp. RNTU_13 TaxID=3375145 RepID=UPI003987C3F2
MKKTHIILCFILHMYMCFAQHAVAQVRGCTDPLSQNYNPSATVNDGSCLYAKTKVKPRRIAPLPSAIKESSGLLLWNGNLWTHNDDTDTNLYALDTLTGAVVNTVHLTGVSNVDWEEITQDSTYLYVGNFGNNASGNRKNLQILKLSKASVVNNSPIVELINFEYANQLDFTYRGANRTDFDCEAMVATTDSIFLFTKQWNTKTTTVYALPNAPGTYSVTPLQGYNVEGLVTGATYLENKKLLVLCGYGRYGSPFLYLFYDFKGHDFFSGNKRKIALDTGILQIEGIATANGLQYFFTCESLVKRPLLNSPAALFQVDLSEYLKPYLDSVR